MTKAYGRRLGEAVRVENAPAIVTRALRTADMAVTEIRWDNPLPQMSDPIQQKEICLHDLKREPRGLIDKPYHALAFYLPRAALDEIADDANAPPIRDLSYEPGASVNDVTIFRLGSLLLPALSHPNQANALFVDHVLLA